MKFKSKREFILYEKGFEKGMIEACKHISLSCKGIIKDHKKLLRPKELESLADFNRHLWEKEGK